MKSQQLRKEPKCRGPEAGTTRRVPMTDKKGLRWLDLKEWKGGRKRGRKNDGGCMCQSNQDFINGKE